MDHGLLIGVTPLARRVGVGRSVAVSAAVWEQVLLPSHRARLRGQCERGRIIDLLWMLRLAIRTKPTGRWRIFFEMLIQDCFDLRRTTLQGVFGYGDRGEPVITVLMPEERPAGILLPRGLQRRLAAAG
jgi:hypothetical protein